MMASLVINSIRSTLDDLERLSFNRTKCVKYILKNLEIFVLCARKLGNDAQLRFDDYKVSTLGSLLQRIYDAVCRNARPSDAHTIFSDLERHIKVFEKEIDQWYITLSDSLPQLTSPTIDEITEIIDSVFENLVYFLSFCYWNSVDPIEAMVEKITFLRNFIRFATIPSVETRQLENLLVHIEAVAVNAARFSHLIQDCFGDTWEVTMPSNLSVLVQKINLIDPHVYESYTRALTSSKLSTQLRDTDHDSSVIMKDFIDSLLRNLWEMLQIDTPIVISTRFQFQLLYEGLRLLRSILKGQPNKFDEKIKEHTRAVICNAGVIIFSLYQKNVEEVVSISGLLQSINSIRENFEGKNPKMPTFNFPRTNELGFLDFLLENLMGMTSCKACYGFQSQFQVIHDELSLLRHFLGEIVEMRNEQKEFEALWNSGVKVAYRVETLIDQLVLGDFQGSCSASPDSTIEEIIKEIKTINSEFYHGSVQDIKVNKVSKTSKLLPSQSSVPIADEIVGFVDEATSIIDRLTRGSKQLKMVAIVGMPGIGKTTLATQVFNDPSVTFHFHLRAWCCVSQLFDKKKVLLELLNQIVPNGNFEIAEQDLAEHLWRELKGKKYLIFLDDVWDIEVWNCLQASFPDDCHGSRIIVTSRLRDVAPQAMFDQEPHFLRQLTNYECLELLQRKLFPRTGWPAALYELGKQIAENCKGLPLTVVIVAGLLATLEPEGWKEVLNSLSSGIISSTDHCMNTLELSYKHLPEYLKPCFLYFGLFPEDQEVSFQRLIWLWIAEGFVLRTELRSIEDAARDYIMELAGRSLVIVAKKRSIGGVKTCRIHDLLHDFCTTKGREENFFQLLKGHDELLSFNEPSYLRRLCVHSERKHFKNLRLFCPRIHSLLFFARDESRLLREQGHDISFIIPKYNRLRVLDIGQYILDFGIPNKIELFVQLKYLAVCGRMDDIPSSIGNLSNLETFILESSGSKVSLPDTFWDLKKLRHLAIWYAFCFPMKNLEHSPHLYELQSCSGATISLDSIEMQLRKFPNIRKLKCFWPVGYCSKILIPGFLNVLESLNVSPWGCSKNDLLGHRLEFDFPENLRKLTLENFWLHQSEISTIGQLPNLEVLKLLWVDLHGNTWDMVEGEFSKLKFLKLSHSDIVRWTASDDQFPCLQRLELIYCDHLEEIPSCLENIYTLETVDVSYCSSSVKSLFKQIQDEQIQLGNSVLKIRITN